MWLGVDLRTGTKKHVFKRYELRAQTMLTIPGSVVNMIGGPIWPLNEHENLHFDDESHTSCKHYEANATDTIWIH